MSSFLFTGERLLTENTVEQGERKQQQFLEGPASSFGNVLLNDTEGSWSPLQIQLHVMDVTELRGERLPPLDA